LKQTISTGRLNPDFACCWFVSLIQLTNWFEKEIFL